jgi:hypothetical protein
MLEMAFYYKFYSFLLLKYIKNGINGNINILYGAGNEIMPL